MKEEDLVESLNTYFPEYSESSSNADPYYIWRIQYPKINSRYVIVCGQELQRIPAASRAVISLYDDARKLVVTSEFSTGWRINITDMELIEKSIIGTPIVVILSRAFINGRDIARQYYALCNDEIVLVRLEDSNGSITPNRYTHHNYLVGPPLPKRTIDEWESALQLSNELENLRALMWIGGIHEDRIANDQPTHQSRVVRPYRGASQYVEEVRQLRTRRNVQEYLSRLMQSDTQWIREAAQLAASARLQ